LTARFTYFAPSAAVAGLVAFHYVLETGPAGLDAGLCASLAQVQIVLGSIDYPLAVAMPARRRARP